MQFIPIIELLNKLTSSQSQCEIKSNAFSIATISVINGKSLSLNFKNSATTPLLQLKAIYILNQFDLKFYQLLHHKKF